MTGYLFHLSGCFPHAGHSALLPLPIQKQTDVENYFTIAYTGCKLLGKTSVPNKNRIHKTRSITLSELATYLNEKMKIQSFSLKTFTFNTLNSHRAVEESDTATQE